MNVYFVQFFLATSELTPKMNLTGRSNVVNARDTIFVSCTVSNVSLVEPYPRWSRVVDGESTVLAENGSLIERYLEISKYQMYVTSSLSYSGLATSRNITSNLYIHSKLIMYSNSMIY